MKLKKHNCAITLLDVMATSNKTGIKLPDMKKIIFPCVVISCNAFGLMIVYNKLLSTLSYNANFEVFLLGHFIQLSLINGHLYKTGVGPVPPGF